MIPSPRQMFFALAMLASGVAHAAQIDYFCLFTSAATAQADSVVGTYWSASAASWDLSRTFPGVKVSTTSALLNGISTFSGFWIVISSNGPNAALDGKVATTGPCYLSLDRDVAKAGGSFVNAAGISGTTRTSLTFSPVPEGSRYPSPLGQ